MPLYLKPIVFPLFAAIVLSFGGNARAQEVNLESNVADESLFPRLVREPTRREASLIGSYFNEASSPRGPDWRINFFEKLRLLIAQTYGKRHPLYGQVMLLKGQQHTDRRQYSQADEHISDARKILQASLPENHVNIFYADLARLKWLDRKGEHLAQMTLAQRLNQTARKVFGVDHTLELVTRSQVALAHYRLGNYRGSADISQKLYDHYKNKDGTSGPEKYGALAHLVGDMVKLGRLTEAEELLRPAMNFSGLDVQKDRWTIGNLYQTDAFLKEARVDYNGAREAFDRAYAIFSEEKYRPKESPIPPNFASQSPIHTALDFETLKNRNFNNTSVGNTQWFGKWIKVNVNKQEILKADQSIDKSIEINDRVTAKLMKNAALRENNITFQKMERVIPLYEPYLEWLKKSVGRESVPYSNALQDLATFQLGGYLPAAAEKSAKEALAIQLSKLGQQHPSTLRSKLLLGQALAKQRLNTEAEKLLGEVMRDSAKNLVANKLNYIDATLEMDRVLARLDKNEERTVLWRQLDQRAQELNVYSSIAPLEKFTLMMLKAIRSEVKSGGCPEQAYLGQFGQMIENLKYKFDDGSQPYLPSYFQTTAEYLNQSRVEIMGCSGNFEAFHRLMERYTGTENAYPLGSNESQDDLVAKLDRWIEITMQDPQYMQKDSIRSRVFGWLWPAEAIALSQVSLARRVGTDIDSRRSRVLSEQGNGLAYNFILDRRLKLNWDFKQQFGSRNSSDLNQSFTTTQPHHPDAFADAFKAAQYLRIDKNSQTMSKAVARAAAPNAKLATLARRYQQLSETVYSNINSGDEAERESAEQAHAKIDSQLQQQFPDYYALASPEPLPLREIQSYIDKDQGLLMIVPSKGDLYVFGVSDKLGARENYSDWHRIKGGEKIVTELVKRLRCQIDPAECGKQSGGSTRSNRSKQGMVDGWVGFEFDRNAAYELYRLLIEPIAHVYESDAGFERQTDKLFVVTTGAISALPLTLLLTEKPKDDGLNAIGDVYLNAPWLSRRFEVSYLPAVSDLKLQKKVTTKLLQITGYGDPAIGITNNAGSAKRGTEIFAGRNSRSGSLVNVNSIKAMDALPGTAAELSALEQLFSSSKSRMFTQTNATETSVKNDDMLAQSNVVIFSTHGVLPDPSSGFTEPGLVFTPPNTASVLDDGFLTASEATTLTTTADLVILSACNTASAGELEGADSLAGLARSFLYSGAQSIYASHWRVDDNITKELIVLAVKYVRDDPDLTRGRALALAMEAIRTGKEADGTQLENWNPDWSHPASWAPFVSISGSESGLSAKVN